MEIAPQRLAAQHLVGPQFADPAAAVRWFGAVQAQDYPAAAWAIGQRTRAATAATINDALARGTILRTHVLRPTWHFVAPEDIRWMLALTAPRVRIALRTNDRRTGIDADLIARSHAVLAATLMGGRRATKTELVAALKQDGIELSNSLGYGQLIMHAELDGLICSGGLRGKQQTYALLDERVPQDPNLSGDEALAELARRYVQSHGPATIADFAWWSGLTIRDAQRGLMSIESAFNRQIIDCVTYWMMATTVAMKPVTSLIHLLPNYDELLVAFKDRRAGVDPRLIATDKQWATTVIFNHVVVRGGQVIGTWNRVLGRDTVEIAPRLVTELSESEREALTQAASQFGAFHDRQALISW